MSPVRRTGALLERLGEPAAAELNDILETQKREATEAVMNHCAERFERRLVEEVSRLRVEMAQGFSGIRQEMAAGRFELLKWSFAFWIGQLVAVAGIVGMLISSARR
jgi:hypothetical protein